MLWYNTYPKVEEMHAKTVLGHVILVDSEGVLLHEPNDLAEGGHILKSNTEMRRVIVKWLLSLTLGNDVAHKSAERLVQTHQEDYPMEAVIDRFRVVPRLKQ